MYRILIVDDEPIIVQGLLSVLEESSLDADLYGANSGDEALSLLSRTRMDIVISDICMPGMDGIELMNHIHKDWPDCQVIFLSGHGEFDIMYQAIRGNAVTFLLKTEGFAKIIATLQETMDKIKTMEHYRASEEQLSMQQEMTKRLFEREALSALVRGRSSTIRAATLEINLEEGMLPLYGYIENETHDLTLEDLHDKLLSIDRILRIRLAPYPIRIAFWNHHEDILWLLQPDSSLDINRCILYIRENLDLIQGSIKHETGMTLAFALHSSAVMANQLSEAYHMLRRQVCQGVGLPGMIVVKSGAPSAHTAPLLPQLLIRQLKDSMEHPNQREFTRLLSQAMQVLLNAKAMDDPYALEAFMTISQLFLSYINRWKLHDQVQFPGGLSGLTSINGFTAWSQAADAFTELGQMLFRIRERDQGNRSRCIVLKIRDHIEQNLHRPEELSLSRIAEITYFNPAYLSRLFHQVLGETLSDYISSARIRRANQLLMESGNRISDISEAVGFSSSANFSRFYRKMTGLSPQEYRDKLAGNSLNTGNQA